MNDDDDQKAYTWEAGYADGLNLGDVLEEDEAGSIEKSIAKYLHDARKKQRSIEKPTKIRLGIISPQFFVIFSFRFQMRYVYLVVDCSKYMPNKALPPSKFFVTMKAIDTFLDKFFEQNPIAQVGVIICKDKKAERCVNLTGNIRQIKEQLSTVGEAVCGGDFSLQNGLQLAMANLKGLPGHVSKEVIVLMASLSTVDPGNIFGTMELLKTANIRCSVIGLSAEMFVCKQLAKVTNGKYDVVLDAGHMDLLFSQHTVPPPTSKATECNAVRVGFPPHIALTKKSFCLCHPGQIPDTDRGFLCEQCGSRYCSLPAECRVCKLTLVAAPQLARAFRHLVPLQAFDAVPVQSALCAACDSSISEEAFKCRKCGSMFCFDCDVLLHESLHVCPTCT